MEVFVVLDVKRVLNLIPAKNKNKKILKSQLDDIKVYNQTVD